MGWNMAGTYYHSRQDDQIFDIDKNCTWMHTLVNLFRKHPGLGAIGHRSWWGSSTAPVLPFPLLLPLPLPLPLPRPPHPPHPAAAAAAAAGSVLCKTKLMLMQCRCDSLWEKRVCFDDRWALELPGHAAAAAECCCCCCCKVSHRLSRPALLPSRKMRSVQSNGAACPRASGPCPCRTFFKDPDLNVDFQCVGVAEHAPYSFRRSAFVDIGGLDEGSAEPGQCGIVSDWEVWCAAGSAGCLAWPGWGDHSARQCRRCCRHCLLLDGAWRQVSLAASTAC